MWRQSRRRPFCSCTSGHTRCRALAECATAEHVQYARWPPRSRRANCMSFTKIVWRLACIAHRLASWNSPTRWASHAVCSASTALDWKRYFAPQVSNATSFARRWNGSLRIRHSVDFWYLRISRRATVPARTRRRWRPRPSAARRRDCYSTFRPCHGWIYCRMCICMRSGTPPPACVCVQAWRCTVLSMQLLYGLAWAIAVWTLHAARGSRLHRPCGQPHAGRFAVRSVATPRCLLGARHDAGRRSLTRTMSLPVKVLQLQIFPLDLLDLTFFEPFNFIRQGFHVACKLAICYIQVPPLA